VLASSIGWVAAEHAYLKLTRAGDVRLFWGAVVSGTLSGAITGLTLVGLMRNTRKNEAHGRGSVPVYAIRLLLRII
jgi:hypothetical protein